MTMALLHPQTKPAYHGAKFDTRGFCLLHPKVRLCKPNEPESDASDEGTHPMMYAIVRKTCHLCGERGLVNVRKLAAAPRAHGYKKPVANTDFKRSNSLGAKLQRRSGDDDKFKTGRSRCSSKKSHRTHRTKERKVERDPPAERGRCDSAGLESALAVIARKPSRDSGEKAAPTSRRRRALSLDSRRTAFMGSSTAQEDHAASDGKLVKFLDDIKNAREKECDVRHRPSDREAIMAKSSSRIAFTGLRRRNTVEGGRHPSGNGTKFFSYDTDNNALGHRSLRRSSSGGNHHESKAEQRGRSLLSSVPFRRSRSHPNLRSDGFRVEKKERRCRSRDRDPSPEPTIKSSKSKLSKTKKSKATVKHKSTERPPVKVPPSAKVAPSTSRYALPFNPTTGCCNVHPHVVLAEKNGSGKGGWNIVVDVCPACNR